LLKKILNKYNLILGVIFLLFTLFTFYLALNVKMGISPDSWYHLRVSQSYSTTLTIPENTEETYQWRDITNIPYLYFWINARVLNLNDSIFQFNQVILLRILNIFYSILTLVGVYLLSKEVIKNKWARLIPLILITNTLMFLLLSSSINYDNLGNMFATFALLFFIKTVKNKGEYRYPLLTILMISLGALTKFTLLPLAVILIILLILELIKDINIWKKGFKKKDIFYILPVLLFGILNILLYGNNLLKHQELIPSCEKILTHEQCLENGVYYRDNITIPAQEVNLVEMILSGERLDPFRYTGVWIWEMTKRTVGIMGDKSFYHNDIVISVFTFIVIISFLIGILNWKSLKKEHKYLFSITISYLLILLIFQNYNMYLKRGFPALALHGRYMFPVISSFYVLASVFWLYIKNKYLRLFTILITILLVIIFSIPYFLLNIDSSWFGTIDY